MARAFLITSLACAVVAGAAPVRAQSSKPVDKKAAAKQYVDAGIAAEKTGDYDTAITMYQKAYDLIPHPVLLFNIGNALRAAGRFVEAQDFFQKYLDADPKGDKVKAARKALEEIEPDVVAEKAKVEADARAKVDAEAKAEAEAEAKRKEHEKEKKKRAPKGGGEKASRPDGGGGWGGMRIAGVVSAGLGVVAVGGGVVFGLRAKSISDEFSQPEAEWDADRYAQGEAAERNMYIGYGVGAALLVTGGVLFVLGADHGVAPIVDEHGAGVALSGRF